MKLFLVSFGSRIAGSRDHVYVMAKDANEALTIGKPMLDTHKLTPEYLNQLGRYDVCEV